MNKKFNLYTLSFEKAKALKMITVIFVKNILSVLR